MSASMGPTAQTQAALDALAAFRQKLKANVAAATPQIAEEVKTALGAIYPAKLAAIWTVEPVETPEESPVLAQVDVSGEDERIRGYEFGTPPHEIIPSAKQALAFTAGEQKVVVQRVHHPGTRAHNLRDEVVTALDTAAKTIWQRAIDDALLELK